MFYMLLFIKAWNQKRMLSDAQDFWYPLGNLHTSHRMFNLLKERYQKLKSPLANQLIANIEEKGYYYNFEMRALAFNILHMKNIISGHFPVYKQRMMHYFPADIHVPIDQLLIDPASHITEFSNSINMSEPLNMGRIENYHKSNLDLFENIFNKPYDKLIQGNWQDEFQEYVNQVCPNNWFSRSTQQP
jgi:hypothetical protein